MGGERRRVSRRRTTCANASRARSTDTVHASVVIVERAVGDDLARTRRVGMTSRAHRRRPGVRNARACDLGATTLTQRRARCRLDTGAPKARDASFANSANSTPVSRTGSRSNRPRRWTCRFGWVRSQVRASRDAQEANACVARRAGSERVRRLTLAGAVRLRTRRTSWNTVRRR